jgi:CheY-like chemotaxis protein
VPVSTLDAKGARSLLVVDDDEATRRLLVRALRSAYTVYEAEDGEAAQALLEEHAIDCVVSDVMMPRMSGTDLARKMRTDPRLKHIPILFVSAKKQASDVADGISSGARFYLSKPFKLKELVEKVESLFAKPAK